MNISLFRRIIESFFRRWPVYAVLFAIVAALGAVTFVRTEASYTSGGTIFVDNQSLVTAQSGVPNGSFFSYLSPAQFTSQELNGLLQTDVFIESVLGRAGVNLESDPLDRADQLVRLRAGMSSYPSSQNLVKVNVSSPDPDLSYELAAAIIAEFVQYQIGLDVAESGASEDFFSDLARSYEDDLEAARQAVDAALRGVRDSSELTLAQDLEIQRLQEAEALAESRYRSAADDIEVARLAMLQTETDIRQSYSTFDPPQRPNQADDDFFDGVIVLILIAGAGTALAMAWPVVSGFTDRTVLFAQDLDEDTTPALALVPRISKRSIRLKYIDPSEPGIDDSGTEAMMGSIYERAARTRAFVPPVSSGQSSERVRSDSRQTLAGSQTNTGLIDNGSRFDISRLDSSESDLSYLDSSESDLSYLDSSESDLSDLIMLGSPVNELDPDEQGSFAEDDGPAADEYAGDQSEADQGEVVPAGTEPTDREDEPAESEPEPRQVSTLMSWASSEEDDHEPEGSFVVVDTYKSSPDLEGERSAADPDGSIDGGEDDSSPGFDPSVTTELQIPPDIPALTRRDGQKADEHQSNGDEHVDAHVTARTHHA